METKVIEQVQHRFTVTDDDGSTFSDALYFDLSNVPDEKTKDAMRVARFNNYKAALAAMPASKPPTEEEVLADIVALEDQRTALDSMLAEKNAALAVMVAAAPAKG